MLKSTLIHIHGIGRTTEELLWKNDIRSRDDFLEKHDNIKLSEGKKIIK